MTAVGIWSSTVAAMVATMAISLTVFFFGDSPFFAVSERADVSIILVLALVATGLRVWSIGLLFRREYDLYMISLACWLASSGIRATRSYETTALFEQVLVLSLGFFLDGVQLWALFQAISRARRRQPQPVP
jgi:hypothetical protein